MESADVILIIEDDAHIAGLVAQVLREAGFEPALVRDVGAARDWCAAGRWPATHQSRAAPTSRTSAGAKPASRRTCATSPAMCASSSMIKMTSADSIDFQSGDAKNSGPS